MGGAVLGFVAENSLQDINMTKEESEFLATLGMLSRDVTVSLSEGETLEAVGHIAQFAGGELSKYFRNLTKNESLIERVGGSIVGYTVKYAQHAIDWSLTFTQLYVDTQEVKHLNLQAEEAGAVLQEINRKMKEVVDQIALTKDRLDEIQGRMP